MSYSLAPSLAAFRAEVNARWPQRDKASDGWIGDQAHQSRVSDHNPGARDLVHAFDTDEDLDGNRGDNGRDAWVIAEHLRLVRDPRIKYVIYEGHMFSSYASQGYSPWVWRPYSGTNAHRKHIHLSIHSTIAAEQDTSSWLDDAPKPGVPHVPGGMCTVKLRVLKKGMSGGDVRSMQYLLISKAGQSLVIDGRFGAETERAVKNIQKFFKIKADGVCGEKTWPTLFL